MRCAITLVVVAFVFVLGAVGCNPTQINPNGDGTCSAQEPCPSGQVCNTDGRCAATCTATSCGNDFCDEASGRCVECLDSTDCGDGTVCNTFTKECVPGGNGGCTRDGDCDRGFCEVASGTCIECRNAADCGAGQRCDAVSKSCVAEQGCTSDFNCQGATPVCEPNLRTCVQCFSDFHCASGACDTATRTCATACVDGDETEPNAGTEANGQPAPLTSGSEHSGSICPGDVDEFTFQAEGNVSAQLTVDGGRLTITLLNAAGTTIGSGTTSVTGTALPAGTYKLRVAGSDGTVEADYLLRLTIVTPQVCTELDPEPNDNAATATALPNNSLKSGTICGSNVDFWALDAEPGEEVSVTLNKGEEGEGVLSFAIVNAAGNILAQGDTEAPIVLDTAPAGAIFARVRATGGDISYSIRAATSAAPDECVQTDPEPNDTPEQAPGAASGQLFNGRICAGDIDQWRFSAQALDDVEVALTGSNIRVQVFDSAGAVIREGTSTFTITDIAAGNYRVAVRGTLSTTETSYTLRVTMTPQPGANPCDEGGLEPDSAASPRTLPTDGVASSGRICTNDTDFYRFTLSATRLVAISVQFTHVPSTGDIDIRLKDAGGTQITASAGTTNEELIIRELAAGTYNLEVFGFLGNVANSVYTARVTIIDCNDDGLEPNNTIATATPISGRAVAGVRCPTNDDFFAIRLETGDALNATLTGGLRLALLSSTGSVLQSDTAANPGVLSVTSQPAGKYLLRVTGSGVAGVSYTLTPTITPSPTRCVDDGAEPNNTLAEPFALDASVLADGSYALTTLTMCDGSINTDHFVIDIPAGKNLRVALDHPTNVDLDVEVLEQRGTSGLFRSLANAVALTGTLDVVRGNINAASRLIIRVSEFGTQPAAGTPYAIGIELQDVPTTGCVDDRFDTWTSTASVGTRTHKNDDFTTSGSTVLIAPTVLSPPEVLPNLQICAGNKDVFRFRLDAGQQFQVDVTYSHTVPKDIDLRVFGPDNSNSPADADTAIDLLPCSTCAGVTGSERFVGTATVTGDHFVEVFEFQNDGENSYELSVTLQ